MAICLIAGIGASFGLLVFASFEIDRTRILEARESKPDINTLYGNSNIQISMPRRNSLIENPVLITGIANVFEATVRIRIKEDDEILTDTFLTAEGSIDKLYDFEGNIAYRYPNDRNGVIEIFSENPKTHSDANMIIIPVVFNDHSSLIKWSLYEDRIRNISFEYPSDLSFLAKTDDATSIIHKIPYEHNDPCLGNADNPVKIEDLIDLQYTIGSISDDIADVLENIEKNIAQNDKKISQINVSDKSLHFIDNHSNNCGSIDYYYEIEPNRTIFIKRLAVPGLDSATELFSKQNGAISPSKEEYIFRHVISSLKTLDFQNK